MGAASTKQLLCIALYVLFMIRTAAQPRCKVEYYSTENGLSHQAVTSIIKDHEGFMWFGTWDGINRFDGRNFVTYKSAPGDLSQLGNDRVDQVVEDQSQHIWIQAYDRNVYRFDKKTEQFLALASILRKKVSFSKILLAANDCIWLQSLDSGLYCVPQNNPASNTIVRYALDKSHFFYQDVEKRIWVGSPKGLNCLTPIAPGRYTNKQLAPAGETGYTAIREDGQHLYMGTENGWLVIYNKNENSFTKHKIANARIQGLQRSKKAPLVYAATAGGTLVSFNRNDGSTTTFNYQPDVPLMSLHEDKQGNIWIAPAKPGVIRFDPAKRSFSYYSQGKIDKFNPINNHVRIYEDNNGLVWAFMKGGGFGYYNAATDAFNYDLNTADAGVSKLPANVYSVYYDPSGVFWLTNNERQLVKIILQGNVFEQRPMTETVTSKFDNEVRGILYDKQNRLWLGTKSGGFYVYKDGVPIKDIFDNAPAEGLGLVYSIMQDSRGTIWLGTKANGLYQAVPSNATATKYHLTHFTAASKGGALPCNEIYSFLEDKQHRIWIGSFDKGLFLVQGDGDDTRFVQSGPAFTKYPKEQFQKIRHLALDAAGNVWIGAINGLLVMDEEYNYKAYHKLPGDKNSLGNNDIQFIYRDHINRMWLATSGGGFCLAGGAQPLKELSFRNYTTKDGMPNDYVLSCTEDKQGNLWIATENGLSCFNAQRTAFRNYDSYDGLPRAAFSEAAALTTPQNKLLIFGTNKGFLSFDPERTAINRSTAGIVLTNLQVNNEDAGPGQNINYLSSLTLPYNQNIISIGYAILDQRAGNRHSLAYRLMGFDSTWHTDRQQRRATYTNLPPGSYVFEVKPLNSDLYSNAPYKKVSITILPPPWKTWWAYALYVLAITSILLVIRRYALAMIKLRHKIAVEQKLAALKMNFFTNVSHELRTPLTLIVSPIEQLAAKEKISPEGMALLDVVRRNAGRMTRFINQLLDFRKIESNKATLHVSRVEMISFVKKIADHFSEAFKAKHITLTIDASDAELIGWIDVEKIDIVLYNLLANALKFTPEHKTIGITIAQQPNEHTFTIAVSDQGPGVEPDKLKEIFDLFYEGDHPMQKGSGIGLALSRELVNLHSGHIHAHNKESGGLTVTVQLRLGFAHFKPQDINKNGAHSTIAMDELPLQAVAVPVHATTNPQASLVLLVEDNDELRAFIASQLSEAYRVETATNGAEGWQKARTLLPDLVVSDIMMPVMDGIQLLDNLRSDINTSHIPFVLLSARHAIESQIEGLQYGADHYITKPFHSGFLMAAIDNLLRQRKKLFDNLVNKHKVVALSPAQVVVTSKDELFMKEVIRIVEEKMTDSDFNIETVAESLHMSRTTFYKKFKSLASLTPVEFVRDMRLQRAKQYLDAGGQNIADIAYSAGFSNPKYFSTCFREKYNVSPTDYLKQKLIS